MAAPMTIQIPMPTQFCICGPADAPAR
jgi:hypothetical protein